MAFAFFSSAFSVHAADPGDVFNFTLGDTFIHDSNVFRLSPSTNAAAVIGTSERGDTSRTQSVGGSFNKLFGRQRVRAELNLTQVEYQRFKLLDYNGGNASLAWDWRATDMLSGTVGKTRTRSMLGFGDFRSPVQNLVTNDNEYVTADVWFMPQWHAEGSLREAHSTSSSPASKTSEGIVTTRTGGLRFTPSSGSFILLRSSHVDGRYPNREIIPGGSADNSYEQTEHGVEAAWLVTGASRLSGAAMQTRRHHATVSARDFEGRTGYLSWQWMPTGKTTLNAKVRREIGAAGDDLASYFLTDAASVGVSWMPTAKLSANLQYERRDRVYAGDPTAISLLATKRFEKIDTSSVNLVFQPHRSLTLSLSLMHDQRGSNYSTYAYKANTTVLSAQLTF